MSKRETLHKLAYRFLELNDVPQHTGDHPHFRHALAMNVAEILRRVDEDKAIEVLSRIIAKQ